MTEVVVAGVGMHRFGRFPEASLKDLARTAVIGALEDSGLAIADIDAVYSANGMAGLLQGQEQIRGQSVLRDIGIERVPIVNIENACASGSSAFREAVIAVRAGVAECVLAVGFEKMFVEERSRTLKALESAADLDVVGGLGLQFTAIYAMRLRKRLDAGLLSSQDLIDVTLKNRENGARNPNAQFQARVTAEEVAAARPIADPLTLLMCSSIGDGAAAAIVTRAGGVKDAKRPRVFVRAAQAMSGFTLDEETQTPAATLCAERAYAEAGVRPHDIAVAEVHDAMAPGELLYYEQLGFCETGGAAALLASGETRIGGRIAVNTSGGLSARGHPVGATGLAQIAELVWQLRGEAGARQSGRPNWALAQNSGGWLEGEPAAVNVHILQRGEPWA